ncbi:YitT family protein [Anaerotignum lactatifermentans]|uniref:YitT family protein n=1 Tax=Anaerotignum lactatifermentans TaxID=160404 RepID=A0ABS2G832_9FIRM|nr:YitT family protein [Anaerotignum lactatifermentans]MBM6828710.1 YitT family protein [Anaerotignum lactatifermentans]MBM6877037.1 YitT family protein [Anaerotignum lactatifermentans]MBM6950292.1 YitT family protein [Anaerotignum lactatifermentans]
MSKEQRGMSWQLPAGAALLALGIQNFMEPAHLVAGGISGLGIILDDAVKNLGGPGVPLWLVNVVCNLPLFAAAWRKMGRQFVGRTILTSLLFSLMLFLASFLPVYYGDLLLAAVYGGAIAGAGLGLVLRGGATTGGVDLAATLLHRKWQHRSVSSMVFFMDAAIILLGTVSFGVEHTLYAILAVYVMEKLIAWVLEGAGAAKMGWIISHRSREICRALEEETGGRKMAFYGGQKWTPEGEEVLFCVFSQKEIGTVKSIIMNIDREACFLVADIREVLGDELGDK